MEKCKQNYRRATFMGSIINALIEPRKDIQLDSDKQGVHNLKHWEANSYE